MEDQQQQQLGGTLALAPLRDDLVNTAVKFLQNPKVCTSPLNQKQDFLRRKGLTENEIQKACELAAVNISLPNQADYSIVNIPPGQPYSQYPRQVIQPTLYHKVKELLNGVLVFAAGCYCIYWFYKKVVSRFLFEDKKKDKKDPVVELDKNIQQVKDSINQVKNDVQQLTQNQMVDPSIPQLVQELKQDLASLKSLLLSRKQFPSAPASIPPWQLEASSQGQEKATEREDDAGSGSSTNNSDSSLEMIREDPPKE